MAGPFPTRAAVDEYLSGMELECLECGKMFRGLVPHLNRQHGISAAEYRARWGIPAGRGLVGRATSALLTANTQHRHKTGALGPEFAARATAAARNSGRGERVDWERGEQSHRARGNRPGDAHRLPPGARRANGEDADRARKYQRAWRALKSGDDSLMIEYRAEYPR